MSSVAATDRTFEMGPSPAPGSMATWQLAAGSWSAIEMRLACVSTGKVAGPGMRAGEWRHVGSRGEAVGWSPWRRRVRAVLLDVPGGAVLGGGCSPLVGVVVWL